MKNSVVYLLVAFMTFVIGLIYLKFAYEGTSNDPFGQELVLIVLGTIATIAITAALISKQSEIELEKEQRVKVFDIKSNLYFELINFIEEVVRKREVDPEDLVTLEFLTHKISILASPEVLREFSSLIQTIKDTSSDSIISAIECDQLSASLAKLCGKIRYDLQPKDKNHIAETQEIIDENIRKI